MAAVTARSAGWRLRLLLPPRLEAAAARDAVAVKVEVVPPAADRPPGFPAESALAPEQVRFGSGGGFEPRHQAAAARLKAWNGGRLAGFVQLRRAQLRALVEDLRPEPAFAWVQRPGEVLAWEGGGLAGVSPALEEPAAPVRPPTPVVPLVAAAVPVPVERPCGAGARVPAVVAARRPASPPADLCLDGSRHYLAVYARDGGAVPKEVTAWLKESGFTLETSNRRWWLRDERKVLAFLASRLAELRQVAGAEPTPNFERNLGKVRTATVRVSAEPDGDGAYAVETVIDAGGAAPEAVSQALAEGRRHVAAPDGGIVLLPAAVVERLEAVRERLGGGGVLPKVRHRVVRAELADAEQALEAVSPEWRPPAEWRERSAALRNLSALQAPPLSHSLESILRLYQKVGVAWLHHLYRSGLGGILADEMGLGKTLQALAFLEGVRQTDPAAGPALVAAPSALVENWRREAARFTPSLRVSVHHGPGRARRVAELAGADLILTSYGTLARDAELMREVAWGCVVGDEAQHVKNRRTQGARALGGLRARGRFLLTGTPVENSVEDLVALFSFVLPGYLAASAREGAPPEEAAARRQRVVQRAAPYLLRRTKRAVAPELPPKIEQTVYCELGAEARAAYERLREETRAQIDGLVGGGASDGRVRMAVLTQILRLRQFCCDPRLVASKPAGGAADGEGVEEEAPGSAKLSAFLELLEEARDAGSRLLVFSQFTSLLDLLRKELQERGVPHLHLDGSTPPAERVARCARFNEDEEIPLFLISLKAGGTGLNLTGADLVVHFDPWWNPAVEAQATDRAHRIGQSRVVTSVKLIVAGTIEEKVMELQRTKAALLEELWTASDVVAARISLAELRELVG